MKKGDIVILRDNFWEFCADWGVNSEKLTFELINLAGKKVYITGITASGLFIQINNINISIPSIAVITLNQQRKNKIIEIFYEDRGYSNSKSKRIRSKKAI